MHNVRADNCLLIYDFLLILWWLLTSILTVCHKQEKMYVDYMVAQIIDFVKYVISPVCSYGADGG